MKKTGVSTIQNIYWRPTPDCITFKEMLLKYNRKPLRDHEPLWHSVDLGQRDGTVIFTYLPSLEEPAKAMIQGQLPYLKWRLADEAQITDAEEQEEFFETILYPYFHPITVEMARDATWDPEKQEVKGAVDGVIDELLEGDTQFSELIQIDNLTLLNETGPATEQQERLGAKNFRQSTRVTHYGQQPPQEERYKQQDQRSQQEHKGITDPSRQAIPNSR